MKRSTVAPALVVGLALGMLALVLIPADVWRAPKVDASYRGFDANVVYATDGVRISRDSVVASAPVGSGAVINLATTLRQRLVATVDATVSDAEARQPFRIGLWSPWTGDGYFLTFGQLPDLVVSVDAVTQGQAGPTLIGGSSIATPVGHYELGHTYRIGFAVDRVHGTIDASVSGDGANAARRATRQDTPGLFGNVQISLTASSDVSAGVDTFRLDNYTLVLPHERSWAVKVDDPVARALVSALALLGAGAVAVAMFLRRKALLDSVRNVSALTFSPMVFGAIVAYVVGNAALFPLGGHPFDFANERFYAYVASTYGTAQLYFLPDVVSLAQVWDGIPWIQVAFPYEPVIAYLSTATGWLNGVIAGTFSPSSGQLAYVIKSINALFGLADGALIYLILAELRVGERWSRIGAVLFIFNPAVWFSMSVWGQTHVFSIFFVLLAILSAQKRSPFFAWLALAAGCLTRPQMVVFALLLGVVFCKKFTIRENVMALAWTVIVVFVALTPLFLATSPSLPIDVLLNNLRVQEAGGNQATLTTVSQDAYSIWPLVTYLFHGASSLQRAFTPSSASLFGSLTYQTASQIITVAAMAAVCVALLRRSRIALDSGAYLPLVAVGVTGFLMLLTGVVATHFLLALPILILCRRWMDALAYWYVIVTWSISTFVPMLGDMAGALYGHGYAPLAPEYNPISNFVLNIYAWDRFITVAIVANICAVIWLAWMARQRRDPIQVAL